MCVCVYVCACMCVCVCVRACVCTIYEWLSKAGSCFITYSSGYSLAISSALEFTKRRKQTLTHFSAVAVLACILSKHTCSKLNNA